MPDDVIVNKVQVIERCLMRIQEEYLGRESELATNFSQQDAIVLNVMRACEAAIDAAMYLVRLNRLGIPQDSRNAFTLLEQFGFLPEDLARQLQAMVGFRNIAVHDYQNLNLDILQAVLTVHLADFRRFCQILLKYS